MWIVFTLLIYNERLMKPIWVAPDSSLEELALVALSVHNAVGRMPIAFKAPYSKGVLIENGEFIISDSECQPLDCMFSGDHVRQIHINAGKYIGTVMFASTILDHLGQRIAAIGIIDTSGMLSLRGFVDDRESIDRQLDGQRQGDKHLIRSRR